MKNRKSELLNYLSFSFKKDIEGLFPKIEVEKESSFNFLSKMMKKQEVIPFNYASSKEQTENSLKVLKVITEFFEDKVLSIIPSRK